MHLPPLNSIVKSNGLSWRKPHYGIVFLHDKDGRVHWSDFNTGHNRSHRIAHPEELEVVALSARVTTDFFHRIAPDQFGFPTGCEFSLCETCE